MNCFLSFLLTPFCWKWLCMYVCTVLYSVSTYVLMYMHSNSICPRSQIKFQLPRGEGCPHGLGWIVGWLLCWLGGWQASGCMYMQFNQFARGTCYTCVSLQRIRIGFHRVLLPRVDSTIPVGTEWAGSTLLRLTKVYQWVQVGMYYCICGGLSCTVPSYR